MLGLHSGESVSPWFDSEDMVASTRLTENIDVDVCVIGGGLGGLSTAYHLVREGKSVCVLEGSELGSGQSGRTAAHFVTALDDRYCEIERLHGERGAYLAAHSHRSALDEVEEIVKRENILCDFKRVDGYLFSEPDSSDELLFKELQAVHRAGLLDVQLVPKAPLDSFPTGFSLRFPNQIQLHPTKYLNGLARSILRQGGRIFTQTHVVSAQGGGEAEVMTKEGYVVRCRSIVVATNTPINDVFAIHSKQAPYRTYVIALHVARDSVPASLFWDTRTPYHYLSVEKCTSKHLPGVSCEKDILIVGGEDHKTGQNKNPELCFSNLEEWTRDRFPSAQEVVYRWSGQVMETIDGLAFLGHNPMDRENVFVITGDSGNGMTHCTIGSLLITDQIMGRKNPWEELYNPSRLSLKAMRTFLRENINVAVQYTDWLSGRKIDSIQSLPRNEGDVFRKGLEKIAAYKDDTGRVALFSAACPHLGCVVSWNNAEKSWDCPCHGSRFNCQGKVLEGPAVKDLAEMGFIDSGDSGDGLISIKSDEGLRSPLNSFHDPLVLL